MKSCIHSIKSLISYGKTAFHITEVRTGGSVVLDSCNPRDSWSKNKRTLRCTLIRALQHDDTR